MARRAKVQVRVRIGMAAIPRRHKGLPNFACAGKMISI